MGTRNSVPRLTIIAQLNRELGHRLYIPTGYYNLMDHEEARRKGWDLADVVMG